MPKNGLIQKNGQYRLAALPAPDQRRISDAVFSGVATVFPGI